MKTLNEYIIPVAVGLFNLGLAAWTGFHLFYLMGAVILVLVAIKAVRNWN